MKDAKYIDGYKVELEFEDGLKKIVDLKASLKGQIFEPLKNKEYFATVKYNPELATIAWDNGADFSPEFLYNLDQA